jgi:transcriptional repressor of cell division inhibition gene dicB
VLLTIRMYKADALEFFKGNGAELARFLGVTRKAVAAWPEIVPEGSAYKLQVKTNGRLKVDQTLYPSRAEAS